MTSVTEVPRRTERDGRGRLALRGPFGLLGKQPVELVAHGAASL